MWLGFNYEFDGQYTQARMRHFTFATLRGWWKTGLRVFVCDVKTASLTTYIYKLIYKIFYVLTKNKVCLGCILLTVSLKWLIDLVMVNHFFSKFFIMLSLLIVTIAKRLTKYRPCRFESVAIETTCNRNY